MEHGPDRDKILESYQILNEQFRQTVERARADLASGLALEDLIVGGGAEFAKTASVEALAFTVICRVLFEARKPMPKPRKRTAVIAKRPKITEAGSE